MPPRVGVKVFHACVAMKIALKLTVKRALQQPFGQVPTHQFVQIASPLKAGGGRGGTRGYNAMIVWPNYPLFLHIPKK